MLLALLTIFSATSSESRRIEPRQGRNHQRLAGCNVWFWDPVLWHHSRDLPNPLQSILVYQAVLELRIEPDSVRYHPCQRGLHWLVERILRFNDRPTAGLPSLPSVMPVTRLVWRRDECLVAAMCSQTRSA